MAKKTVSFENAIERLEEIVRSLESGDAELENALKLYEEGIGLVRSCTEQLEKAEQKIKAVQLQSDGTVALVDFGKEGEGAV